MKEDNRARPNLIYVCHEFPKLTETFVYREVQSLLERGWNVRVFSMKEAQGAARIECSEEIFKIVSLFHKDLGLEFFKAQLRWFWKKPMTYIRELFRIIGECRNKKDVSYLMGVGLFLRGVVLADMIRNAPGFRLIHAPATGGLETILLHTAHALTGIKYGFTLHSPPLLFIESPLLATHARDATWIASISKEARERLVKLAGESVRNKIGIVHCGVKTEDFQIAQLAKNTGADCAVHRKKIVAVGSLIDFKGHDILINAVAEVIRKGLNVSLDIIGEGERRERLENMIADKNIEDRVILCGGLHPKQVREALRQADVFSLASRVDSRGARDGVPVAIMEAMATGLPCVSTYVSGIPELIENGVSGLLVEPDDFPALAAALEKILADSEFASKLGKAAREKIEREYTLDGQVQKLEELISAKAR